MPGICAEAARIGQFLYIFFFFKKSSFLNSEKQGHRGKQRHRPLFGKEMPWE